MDRRRSWCCRDEQKWASNVFVCIKWWVFEPIDKTFNALCVSRSHHTQLGFFLNCEIVSLIFCKNSFCFAPLYRIFMRNLYLSTLFKQNEYPNETIQASLISCSVKEMNLSAHNPPDCYVAAWPAKHPILAGCLNICVAYLKSLNIWEPKWMDREMLFISVNIKHS